MKTSYCVTGTNKKALFTLKIHRGDGMLLLAMNWRKGKPPRNFVGFAIEYKEPNSDLFWPVKNRIGFPGQRKKPTDPMIPSTRAPIQKFRWVHFPWHANRDGEFHYRVTPMFMDELATLGQGEPQEASVALMRETIPGKLNVAFTRGYVSSQSFVEKFAPDRKLSTLIPDNAKEGLDFKATHKKAEEAHEWMGFEARASIHEVLDEAIAAKAEVRVIAYDLNLPEILSRLKKLGRRLKIIIDDSSGTGGGHRAKDSPESLAEKCLRESAGDSNVKRQHMANLQHHKSIAVSGKGLHKVVYGSTNFSWRGFYVQSNNAIIVDSKRAVDEYFDIFESYFSAERVDDFRDSQASVGWHDIGVRGLDAKVGFSPHTEKNGLLTFVGKDIDKANSSVLFSLAFLGQMKKGPIGPALGRAIQSKTVHALGIADARVKEGNLGVTVLTADNKRRVVRSSALTGNVPAPFRTEPSGLSGSSGQHRGTRMHHKFVVLDFNTADARVYLGSYNFSELADFDNGENLVLIRNRTVATSYMIEALRIYDHYRFRSVREDEKTKGKKILELQLPPKNPTEKPRWQKDWDDPIRKRDRELFA
jgi:phosphatidylserine/phosphatidylglycerophosphate/cardiolipin synthase-like enzyme